MAGNSFHAADSAPWSFPFDNAPVKNISSPPTTQSSAIEKYPSSKLHGQKKRKNRGDMALTVGGGTLIALCAVAALVVVVHAYRTRASKIRKVDNSSTSFHTLTISPTRGKACNHKLWLQSVLFKFRIYRSECMTFHSETLVCARREPTDISFSVSSCSFCKARATTSCAVHAARKPNELFLEKRMLGQCQGLQCDGAAIGYKQLQ